MKPFYNRRSFFALPIVFSLLIAGILWACAWPALRPYYTMLSLLVTTGGQQEEEYEGVNLLEQLGKELDSSQNSIPYSKFHYPQLGDQYAQVTVEGTSVDAPVFLGDDSKQLNKGVGTYNSYCGIPGMSRTIILAGHTNTWFADLGAAEIGGIITVETYYGTYTYRITDAQVKDYQDTTAYDLDRTDENIILYTCYPFGTLGFTRQRYFVYGEYLSGPIVDMTQ